MHNKLARFCQTAGTGGHATLVVLIVGLLILNVRQVFATEPPAAIPSPNGLPWIQTFSNDFTSSNGSTYLNNWTKQTGDGTAYNLPPGWGNNEAEIYTTNSSNVSVTGAGLNITAIVNGSNNITSARITSQNYFSQTYGLFQFTASIPSGGGLWPALWMLPNPNSYGGWPTSGEIDVFESGGNGMTSNKQVQGTFHSGVNYMQDVYQTAIYPSSPGTFDTRNSNTYDLLWLPASTTYPHGLLNWYVNGFLYESRSGGWYNPGGGTNAAPFDKPFYFLMNMAIGGSYTGGQIPANGSYTMTISDVEAFSIPILGDVNRDGHLDARDIADMEKALTDPATFAAAHGVTTVQLGLMGDLNADTKFTAADVQKLIATLKSGGGSSEGVPEPASATILALAVLSLLTTKRLRRA